MPMHVAAVIRDLSKHLNGQRVLVLSGAGLSTESGIPDYRGPETRRRYWARAMIGWPRIANAAPNAGHRAVAELQAHGAISGVITQNVDRLHSRAGSRDAIELHGALQEVRCLDCGTIFDRDDIQARLEALNPGFVRPEIEVMPDGDAEVHDVSGFLVPGCETCGGPLKPNVVYFGESVPRARVELAYQWLEHADVLLVLGSSLQVFSGFRFVPRATALQKSVVIINREETRGDSHARLIVRESLGSVLPPLARALGVL